MPFETDWQLAEAVAISLSVDAWCFLCLGQATHHRLHRDRRKVRALVNEVACVYFVHRPQWVIEAPMLLYLVGDLVAGVREALAEAGSMRSDQSHREP